MGTSKVIYGGKVLMDLTADSVTAETLLVGSTAHGADGELINGACDYDANTQDATAAAAEILNGKTAYNKGVKVTGTMVNRSGSSGEILNLDGGYTIKQGYHDGSGTVTINADDKAKLIPANIRDGVTILGVEGTMSGSEGVKPQAKSVTPGTAAQTVLPDTGYTHLSQVTVAAIPYTETDNSAGGKTVTIA